MILTYNSQRGLTMGSKTQSDKGYNLVSVNYRPDGTMSAVFHPKPGLTEYVLIDMVEDRVNAILDRVCASERPQGTDWYEAGTLVRI